MSTSERKLWIIYAAGAGIAFCVLAGLSYLLLDSERSKSSAQAEVSHLGAVNLALWRMDSWFAPMLAQEAARPFLEYDSFGNSGSRWTQAEAKSSYARDNVEPLGFDFSNASRLLAWESDFTRLHFQVSPEQGWSSPQIPAGSQLTAAVDQGLLDAEEVDASRVLLEELRGLIPPLKLKGCTILAEDLLVQQTSAALDANDFLANNRVQTRTQQPVEQQRIEMNYRALNIAKTQMLSNTFNANPQQILGEPGDDITVGAMVPIWLRTEADAPPELCFVRRVQGQEVDCIQGFLADWPAIEAALLQQASDLLSEARLIPILDQDAAIPQAARGQVLAALPVRLSAPFDPATYALSSARTNMTLGISWLAALLALGTTGFCLRASIAYGEKRSLFASTVTHELRTPLTTFRMYSEMLAKDMVPADRRVEYLQTLQRESERLSTLVENVLAYARLEDGRGQLRRETLEVNSLIDDLYDHLSERAAGSDVRLCIHTDSPDVQILSDREAVGQILFNLVDNACKYGRGGSSQEISLSTHVSDQSLCIDVRDHGRGIPASQQRAIFHPFDRGALDPADENPGVGLGLALSRGLARDLGGDLCLLKCEGAGACFRLRLPLSG